MLAALSAPLAFIFGVTALAVLALIWCGYQLGRFFRWWGGALVLILVPVLALAQDVVVDPGKAQGWLLTAFIQYLLPVLATGASALLGLALKALVAWLKAKAETAAAESVQKRVLHAVSVASEGASGVVAHLNATVVDELKKASADGKVSPAELASVKATALAELKKLPAPVLEALTTFFGGSLDTWLSGLIEQKVSAAKLPPS